LHRTFYVIPGVARPGGAELGPMELALEGAKFGSLTLVHPLRRR
jgi:hypothetical protein